MTWRARARAVIQDAILAAGNEPSPLDPAEAVAAIVKRIDAAYPFGPRQHHPYKIWLSERRRAIAQLSPAVTGPAGCDCPACGARAGKPCRSIMQPVEPGEREEWPDGAWHVARIEAARAAQPDAGPLFDLGGEA